MVWYSHLLKNFPEFVVVHTVKDLSIVNSGAEDRNAAVIYHTLLQPATTGTLTLEARNVFARCAKGDPQPLLLDAPVLSFLQVFSF